MGTCAVGIGATVRQPSLRTRAGTVTGRALPVPSTALEMAATNVGFAWLEFSCSADAQQLSACAWVMTRCDPEPFVFPLCIGHALSEQQAIRASGVGAHPAQTIAFPAERRTASASANSCLLRVSTCLGCRSERQVSTRLRFDGHSAVRLGRDKMHPRVTELLGRLRGKANDHECSDDCDASPDGIRKRRSLSLYKP